MSESQDGYASMRPTAPSGDTRLYQVRLTKVSSFIFMTQQRHTSYTGTLEQLEAAARSVRTHNLLMGWWGIPFGLIWTPLALARNAKGMRQVHELASKPPGT